MPASELQIGGFVPFTTVDFPGRLSAVVFCQGCGWRCRYCHNTHLQPYLAKSGAPDWKSVLAQLDERRGFLEAVVFSGGEPTAQRPLPGAMRHVREMGYLVGLHTAGVFPRRLERALPHADWVGLDIKAPFDARYDLITGRRGSWLAARRSLELVLASGVPCELRTTVHPTLTGEEEKSAIVEQLAALGAGTPVWQSFRPHGCADESLL